MTSDTEITRALERAGRGEAGAADELLPLVYDQLKGLAQAHLRKIPAGQTLQATALVHEAWLRLGGNDLQSFDSRAHFFGAAARAMRNILVDQARRRAALKRGAGANRELPSELQGPEQLGQLELLAVDEALDALQQQFERPARIVMLRYFAGLEIAQVATVLGLSPRTVDREWLFARTWLRRFLERGQE